MKDVGNWRADSVSKHSKGAARRWNFVNRQQGNMDVLQIKVNSTS